MNFLPTIEFVLGNHRSDLVYLELQSDFFAYGKSSYKTNRSKTNYNVSLRISYRDLKKKKKKEGRLLVLTKSGSFLLPAYPALLAVRQDHVINSGKWTVSGKKWKRHVSISY